MARGRSQGQTPAWETRRRLGTLFHGMPVKTANWSPASHRTAWRLHREVVMLAGWARAILLQLAHPLVAQGVADHSGFASDRWGRVRRLESTLRAMLALTFGPSAGT